MNRIASLSLAGCLLLAPARFADGRFGGPRQPPPHATVPASTATKTQSALPSPVPAYTLTPERRARAIAYSRTLYTLYFLGTLISIGIYLLLWRTRLAVFFRNWARRVSCRRFIQCLIFVPLFAAAASLLNLPIEFYSSYVLEHQYGLATQGLASWFGDWAKSLLVVAVIGTILAWIFYAIVRGSPRRWWFYFWLTSIPLVLALLVIEPYAIEPLFYNFTPLETTQPALVGRIEGMLSHAGLSISPTRIFEMDASSRTKTINAYVSGLGSSKRVVVWDTTLKAMTPDQLLLVLGHETGHYVLHHILKEFALDEAVALVLFFLGFLGANRLIAAVGPGSGIEGIGDLASLPLLLVVLTLLAFLADPVVNGISRYYEHQADQFGLEVAYGIVPDPNAAEVQSFQILGDQDLSDPDPSPIIKFWLYTHPALADRIRFAATYKPWSQGKPLKLLPVLR